MPQKSGAGGEEDPHQQQYSNEEFYEAGEGDTEESGEDTSEGRKKQKKSSEGQTSQCRYQGPNGQHKCEAEATEDGRCDLCLLGCATGAATPVKGRIQRVHVCYSRVHRMHMRLRVRWLHQQKEGTCSIKQRFVAG